MENGSEVWGEKENWGTDISGGIVSFFACLLLHQKATKKKSVGGWL
ncbi:hypothetical protein GWO43_07120 [candidate division KSB1 bacterium]|nr:hypothetical protein [candidate division KSB1 bacterium]NIR72779.1 hypothetical protein [candidate division KSB1 bacterium]NIS23735.1 hypothetical protein [candidate division KSB1 bacterium]NIT70655.1 hypothetical protein [candidate division KSB1 bacterium]NIU24383.1 hypothetical protein [candidate division KSB1 bacterium]